MYISRNKHKGYYDGTAGRILAAPATSSNRIFSLVS